MKDFDMIFWHELNRVISQKAIVRINLVINGYDKIRVERCNVFNSNICDLFYDR